MLQNGPLFRVLHPGEVAEPPSNVLQVGKKLRKTKSRPRSRAKEAEVLAALEPDRPFNYELDAPTL